MIHAILMVLVLTGLGCAIQKKVEFTESNRNKQLRVCVNSFIDKSISPKSSVILCERIYRVVK